MAYRDWLEKQIKGQTEAGRVLGDAYAVAGLRKALAAVPGAGDFLRALDSAVASAGQTRHRTTGLAPATPPPTGRDYYDAREQRLVAEKVYMKAVTDQKALEELRKSAAGRGHYVFRLAGWDPDGLHPETARAISRRILLRVERELEITRPVDATGPVRVWRQSQYLPKGTTAGLVNAGGSTLRSSEARVPFGKYKGKKLDELPDYYIAYLHGIRGSQAISGTEFGFNLDRFFEHPWVRQIIRDYTEDHESSSPADLRPYLNPYDPRTWNTDLYWKEFQRHGFGVSDSWESQLYGRSGHHLGAESTAPRAVNQGLYNTSQGFVQGRNQTPWYQTRRLEFRFSEEYDPESYEAKARNEHLKVLGSKQRGAYRYWRKRLLSGVPSEATPRLVTRFDEETQQWVEEVKYQQRFGLVRWKLKQASSELARRDLEGKPGPETVVPGTNQEALDYFAKQERLEREFGRVFGGISVDVDPNSLKLISGRSRAVRRRHLKLEQYEEPELRKQPTYIQQIMEAPSLEELQRVTLELEDKYGLQNIRDTSGQIDEQVRYRMEQLVKDRAAGLAGGSPSF